MRKDQRGCRTQATSEGLDLVVALQVEKVLTLGTAGLGLDSPRSVPLGASSGPCLLRLCHLER